jgi:hypothetical protein
VQGDVIFSMLPLIGPAFRLKNMLTIAFSFIVRVDSADLQILRLPLSVVRDVRQDLRW